MDWDKLKIFHAVAEAGNFTKATYTLNLSQSAISRQIQSLEQELKTQLFERHARGLSLTENGEYLFKTAHEVISKLKDVESTLMDKKNKQWVIINLLGRHGMAEIFVFSKTYEKVQDIISTDRAIFIQGTPSTKNEEGEIQRFVAENIIPLEEVRKRFSNNINIRFKTKQKNKNTLNTIKELIAGYTGNCGLVFNMIDSDGSCQRIRAGNIKVSYSVEFLEKLREIMDHENIWID